MLFAKALRSPHGHAKITKMDISKAETLPGVKLILKYDDAEIAAAPKYKTIFSILGDEAHFYGQPVGVVVCAETEQICDQALELISIEWEQLPVILDPEAALKADAPILRPDRNKNTNINGTRETKYGDIEAGFKAAEQTIEFTQVSEEDMWAGVEPNTCVVEYKGDYMEVWYHDQVPKNAESGLARYTTGRNNVNVHVPYQGGLFGGLVWTSYLPAMAHLPAILAKRVGKPVKFLDDGSIFLGAGEKIGAHYYKVGFKKDGTITAVQVTAINTALTLHDQLIKIRECTKIPNFLLKDTWPYYTRGPGVCYKHGDPAAAVQNLVFTHVADALKMDPTQLAIINDGTEGYDAAWMKKEKAAQGFNPDLDSLKDVLAVGKKAINWDANYHLPGTRILPNGKYHGIGFTWIVCWNLQGGTCGALVKVRQDGKVSILSRHADGGWNGESTYCQVVADELGVKYEDVTMRPFDDPAFDSGPGGSSSGMIRTIPGMIGAARKLKQFILELVVRDMVGWADTGSPFSVKKALFPGKKPEELDIKDGVVFEKTNPDNKKTLAQVASNYQGHSFDGGSNLTAWDYPEPPNVEHFAYARQCYFVEVEVDPETGMVDVTKTVVVNDCGKAINPEACNGQQYGGVYMGVGCTFKEAKYYDQMTGVCLNDNLIGYEVALMNDIGPIDCYLVEDGFGYAPYGTTGIGESSAATLRTIGGPAIYNAIGKWIDDFPVTPNKVLKALGKA